MFEPKQLEIRTCISALSGGDPLSPLLSAEGRSEASFSGRVPEIHRGGYLSREMRSEADIPMREAQTPMSTDYLSLREAQTPMSAGYPPREVRGDGSRLSASYLPTEMRSEAQTPMSAGYLLRDKRSEAMTPTGASYLPREMRSDERSLQSTGYLPRNDFKLEENNLRDMRSEPQTHMSAGYAVREVYNEAQTPGYPARGIRSEAQTPLSGSYPTRETRSEVPAPDGMRIRDEVLRSISVCSAATRR